MSGSLYQSYIQGASNQYGVPSNFLNALIQQESSFNPYAQNGSAYGIAQFIPSTAQQYGVDVTDPQSSIYGAAHYLSDLYQQTGSWVSAANRYGTIPSSVSSMTTGQQNVYNVASNLDASGTGLGGMPALSLVPGGFLAGQLQKMFPSLFGSPTTVGDVGNAAGSAFKWTTDWILRIGIFVVALIFIGVGFTSLAAGSIVNGAANTLAKALKHD